jgi:thiol-disulfide isomerase/thioredoxin
MNQTEPTIAASDPGCRGEPTGSLRPSGKPTLLVFTDPNCGPCQALLPEVGRWQRELTEELTISLISQGEPEQDRAEADKHGLSNVALQGLGGYRVLQGVGHPDRRRRLPDGSVGSPWPPAWSR